MGIPEFLGHKEKSRHKEHFKHLVQIALADGRIETSEQDVLHRIGSNLGFSDTEIGDIIRETRGSAYEPPDELKHKFEQLYSMVQMIMADGNIDLSEMRLAYSFLTAIGFTTNDIDFLLNFIIEGIRMGKTQDDLFLEYIRIHPDN